jgi:hypothetical protein
LSFITTGLRELSLKARRQRTRIALKHEKRLLQKSEIALGREGTAEAARFPEVRNEIVALKKLEQEQREVTVRIARIEEALKQIESKRQENSRTQNSAIAKMEDEKHPLTQHRDEAKTAADRCEAELATVERRLKDNEAADRELMKKISALGAIQPPPADFQGQMDRLSAQRSRLPREKEQMEQARLGSADACRSAREKLAASEALVTRAEKEITKTRSEFESRERELAESAQAQQEEARQARAQHQTVEEKKNPAYLNIGRHLASQGIAPPSAPHLLTDVQRHRTAVDRHSAHKQELIRISAQIDKQELRKFYFTIFSLLVLLAIILPLISQSPTRREWLPAQISSIFSIEIEQLRQAALTNKWRKQEPESWAKIAAGLFGEAARVSVLNLTEDAHRVTRAFPFSEHANGKEYDLVETRGDLAPTVRAITRDTSFTKTTISGLIVWQRPDLALGRVGPRTLAIGSTSEVEKLIKVRLGIEPDLKVDAPLLEQFQALKSDSAIRLVSDSPTESNGLVGTILHGSLLEAAKLLAFETTLSVPAKAHLVVRAIDEAKAKELATGLQNATDHLLGIPGSDFVLSTETPKVDQKKEVLDVKFDIPEGATRLLLQRLARVQSPSPPASP